MAFVLTHFLSLSILGIQSQFLYEFCELNRKIYVFLSPQLPQFPVALAARDVPSWHGAVLANAPANL
jgi:hypothetical protein